MPGAFTSTCTKIHLPGYIELAPKFASLGIESIAVLTTNDRFVNEEWGSQLGLLTAGQDPVTILCDGDGDLVKSLGLADDMGFGLGTRSKRFAMVLDNGVVTQLLTDDGLDDCSATSAKNLYAILKPDGVQEDEAMNVDFKVIGGGLLAVVALVILGPFAGGGSNPSPPSARSTPPTVRVTDTPRGGPAKSSTRFSLLEEFK
jgi:glutaredoxin/glutathione-dependent peroxiredoxin